MNDTDRQAAKGSLRARMAAERALSARRRLHNMLCATNTHADADALLDRAESESATAARLRAVMDICDEIERGNPPSPEVAAVVLRIHAAALGDKPAHRGPGRPASELPDWAIIQLSERGIDTGEVAHFFASRDGRTIGAAVDGKPVRLTR